MNKRFSVLLTVLVLVLALSACGSGKQNNNAGNSTQDPDRQADTIPGGDDTSGAGTIVPGRDDNTVTAPDTTPGKNPAVTDDTGSSAGTDLEDMVENARVHDRDGDLLDGENTVAPGASRW